MNVRQKPRVPEIGRIEEEHVVTLIIDPASVDLPTCETIEGNRPTGIHISDLGQLATLLMSAARIEAGRTRSGGKKVIATLLDEGHPSIESNGAEVKKD